MNRTIIQMNPDTFFVFCERRNNFELSGKPIIIGREGCDVVASFSYGARYYSVRAVSTLEGALRPYPKARIIRGDRDLYSGLSHEVTAIIEEVVLSSEKASIDNFYLDLSGIDHFFGVYRWACKLADRIVKETGLPISSALSDNKTVSKIGKCFRLDGLKLTGLVYGEYRLNFFEYTREMMNLCQLMDKIKLYFGQHAIGRASDFSFS